MQHDTIALMSAPTADETKRAREALTIVSSAIDMAVRSGDMDLRQAQPGQGHTPESVAVMNSMGKGRELKRDQASWVAALSRLERAENARPEGASPLTTIDRVRQLSTDMELQHYARQIVLARSIEQGHKVVPVTQRMEREMGPIFAGDVRTRMEDMSTASLAQFGRGKPIQDRHDAIVMGSVIAPMLDQPNRAIDGITAERFGIERKRGVMDRLAGRSPRDIDQIAPEEERQRMLKVEDGLGIARGRGPAETVGNREIPGYRSRMDIHGAERLAGDYLQGGERLEQRIAIEKAALGKLDNDKLEEAFLDVMPKGSIPHNPNERDRWIDAALRNEQAMVASGVAPSYVALRAVTRERGEIPQGPEAPLPSGAIFSSSFARSSAAADNLERTSDTMLRRRFGQVHGMDFMPIPESPSARHGWIHQANMLSIAVEQTGGREQSKVVGVQTDAGRPPLEAGRDATVHQLPRPAVQAAMAAAAGQQR